MELNPEISWKEVEDLANNPGGRPAYLLADGAIDYRTVFNGICRSELNWLQRLRVKHWQIGLRIPMIAKLSIETHLSDGERLVWISGYVGEKYRWKMWRLGSPTVEGAVT